MEEEKLFVHSQVSSPENSNILIENFCESCYLWKIQCNEEPFPKNKMFEI